LLISLFVGPIYPFLNLIKVLLNHIWFRIKVIRHILLPHEIRLRYLNRLLIVFIIILMKDKVFIASSITFFSFLIFLLRVPLIIWVYFDILRLNVLVIKIFFAVWIYVIDLIIWIFTDVSEGLRAWNSKIKLVITNIFTCIILDNFILDNFFFDFNLFIFIIFHIFFENTVFEKALSFI
jgi:hypothetical protein